MSIDIATLETTRSAAAQAAASRPRALGRRIRGGPRAIRTLSMSTRSRRPAGGGPEPGRQGGRRLRAAAAAGSTSIFAIDGVSGKLTVQLHDKRGNVTDTLLPSKVLELATAGSPAS